MEKRQRYIDGSPKVMCGRRIFKYENGQGTQKNALKAVQWLEKAAEQGDVVAQNKLGVIYDNGEGVPKNHIQAFKWFKKAAEQGNREAQNKIGKMYLNGSGVSQDVKKAHMWLTLALDLRYLEAHKTRDITIKKLSKKGFIEAQRMAQRCIKNRYKNC